jgi:polysaccharide pyruvyl transferase CsaB
VARPDPLGAHPAGGRGGEGPAAPGGGAPPPGPDAPGPDGPTVVVSGYYGFGNAGDEAILAAMADGLPEARLVVLSHDPDATVREHGVEAVPRNDPVAVIQVLRAARLVVSGGGSLFQDATGPGSIPYYLGVIAAARALGRPVMVYAQGIGPVRSGWGRRLLRLLDRVQLITTRDEASADFLRRAGVRRPPLEVTADAALALPRPPRGEHPLLPSAPRPRIGWAIRPWTDGRHLEAVAQAADAAAARLGGVAVFVPMQFPDDLDASRRVVARMRRRAVVVERRLPARELPSLFAGLDVLVGMRLHALIFAALAGTPLVGVSYDPKVDHFVRSLGVSPPLPADQLRPQDVAERVAAARPPDDGVVARLQARARRNAELARLLLEGYG